jgi:hypothetical protein
MIISLFQSLLPPLFLLLPPTLLKQEIGWFHGYFDSTQRLASSQFGLPPASVWVEFAQLRLGSVVLLCCSRLQRVDFDDRSLLQP